MAKRLFLSCFLALVAAGVFFYLFYMLALTWIAIRGPLNPANDVGLQFVLRHYALPARALLGLIGFALGWRRFGRPPAETKRAKVKVVAIR